MPVRLVSHEELPGPLQGYRLIERLGRGGFGEVWKVEAPGGLLKAAKFVFGDLDAMDEDSRPAEQELKALKRVRDIRHPYVLSLERFDQIDGQLIIVMELADRNLWDRFRECRGQGLPGVPRDELLRYMEEAAEALDLMNSHYQIQHLDIKPQNLFLVFNHVKVGDFGLAKLLEGVRATVTGGVTPVYAAPETFEGWVSRFSDQYSLGIVFQELLTGTRPFNGTNTRQLLMQHINGTPELGSLPPADRPVIARALSKKPDDRWPTCAEMVRALKLSALAGPPPTPAPAPVPPPFSSPVSPAAPRREPAPMATQLGFRPTRDSGVADSIQATRVAAGGSGRLGPDPVRAQSLTPGVLPPLVKPGGNAAPPPGTPLPAGGARLVAPSAAVPNPAMTLNKPLVFQTGRMGTLGLAPPERHGDGPLFPALVVAVGKTGKMVAEQLKRLIADRYGNPDKVPNVRFLYVDTDPASVPAAVPEDPGALAPRESVLARLNRPGHYLQRESLPPVDAWMPSGTLYKLARSPDSAGGVRAFGRLALFDNYRPVVARVRQEVEAFLTDAPLAEADKNTKLGLRTNRPRVYLLAGLAGGTGGGMFLDLAFLLRHEFRQVGYLRPEVVGLFFVPRADKDSPRNAALGNAHAALAELHHFQARRTPYQAVFDKAEPAVVDTEPPFARVAVLPFPKKPVPREQAAAATRAARALFNEVLTPAGRVTDEVREVYARAFPRAAPTCQTFGLFRLCWPRPEVLTAAARRFAQRKIERWMAKDAAHLREPVAAWLTQQWADRKLDLDAAVAALQGAVRDALREEPDRVFDAFIDPLRTRTPGGRLDAASACAVLDQLLKVVGKPDCENDPHPGSLQATLTARYEKLLKEAEGSVGVMAATFLEVPEFRLAGAEEAVRQIGERLKQQVDALESVRSDLEKEVRTTYARLFQSIGTLGSGSGLGVIPGRKAGTAEVLDLLRSYPRKRLQLHFLDLALSVYRRLLGNAPEYLRDINFCRSTLADLHAALAQSAPPKSPKPADGKLILPDGCADVDAAADRFLAGISPEDLLAFEQALQKEVAKKFRGLGSVCLKPADRGPRFRELLLDRAREFLDARLDRTDPAVVFFRCRPDENLAEPLVGEAFGEAAPELTIAPGGEKPAEMIVLGAPPGKAGDRFRALAGRVMPGVDLTAAPLPEDICFYREYPQLDMAGLPQLGEFGREAYQQMPADHPPHTRTDVPWQQPGP